mgnify:CR=1 FL=1
MRSYHVARLYGAGRWSISQLLLRQTQLRGVVCSGSGFSERYQQMTGNLLTSAAIVTLAQRGDACAMQQVARFRQQLARTLATIVNVVDPGVIVIGGGLSNVELLITDLNAEVAPLVFTDQFTTPIVKAQHGDSSGMRGAAWLAMRNGEANETFTN